MVPTILKVPGRQVSVRRQHNRRRLAVFIVDGQVELRVPVRCSPDVARRFLIASEAWIDRKLKTSSAPKPKLSPGACVPYLGRQLKLTVRQGPLSASCVDNDLLIITDTNLTHSDNSPDPNRIQELLERWFVRQALPYLQQRTQVWAARIGCKPSTVTVGRSKSAWGSCSSRGRLRFTLHLLKAAPQLIDAIVIHELCHLLKPNHSPQFWSLVAQHDPDYRTHNRWFTTHGAMLMNW